MTNVVVIFERDYQDVQVPLPEGEPFEVPGGFFSLKHLRDPAMESREPYADSAWARLDTGDGFPYSELLQPNKVYNRKKPLYRKTP